MERHVRTARFKRPRVRKARRQRSLAALTAALFALILVPTVAVGAADDLVNGVLGGVGGAGERAGTPPNYQPPLHGTNPHGQGTVGVVDISPSNAAPLPSEPSATGEEVIIGDSRGEQSGGSYNGRVTLLHVNLLGIINQSIVEVKTQEGQTNTGPTGPLNTALNQICTASANAVCLSVLNINSSSTANGSSNSFNTLGADVGGAAPIGASVDVASSSGNISDDGNCQTATGSSNVATATVTAPGAGPIGADVLSSSTTSQACSNGQKTQTNDSNVVNLNGTGVPVPAAGCGGPNEVPNTVITPVPGVLALVCNADDKNGSQTSEPYGVREALTAFATLPIVGTLIKVAISGPESHAVAPPADVAGEVGGPGNPGNPGGPGNDAGPAAGEVASGGDSLPFTGSNLLLLTLIGVGLIALGLAATTLSRHQGLGKQP